MNPFELIPSPDTLPLNFEWLHVLLIFTFVLHIISMNITLGLGIITTFYHIRGRSQISEEISHKIPFIMAFAINLGIPPLLFLQLLYGQFFYVSSVLMAKFWLIVIPLLIIAYYGVYIYDLKKNSYKINRVYYIIISVLILLFIGFIYSNNMSLMLRPDHWTVYFENKGGTVLNISDPVLLPRYLHFMMASIALGGLTISIISWKKGKDSPGIKAAGIPLGLRWFAGATIIQTIVGVWFLSHIPVDIIEVFMGGDIIHTVLLVAGIFTSLISIFYSFKAKLFPCAGWTLLTIVIMVLIRDKLRSLYIAPYFEKNAIPVKAQLIPFLLFVMFLVAGIITIYLMIRFVQKRRIRD